MSAKRQLVVIGNGMAPGRMLEKVLEVAPEKFAITIFNAEPRVNYNRLMLSPVLAGEKSYEDIITHDDHWYESHGITLYKGAKVTEVDRVQQTVTSDTGITMPYDDLVFATGSTPIIIPLPGHELDGVLTYRDLDDVDEMLKAAQGGGRAVVIGGGLLGLEAAAGLKLRGMEVTVLHLMPSLMERQLDPAAGYLLASAFAERGIDVITEAHTKEILGTDGRVSGVLLEDGRKIDASIVVMAVGIRPSITLADMIGLDVDRGIQVDDSMRTSDPFIYALGECVEHRGQSYGLVAPLYDMADVAARNLCGESAEYQGSVTATKLKVTGVDLYSAGDFADQPGREEIVLRDAVAGVYKRLVLQDNRIVGAVLYGDTRDGAWYFDMLKKGVDISEMRDTLIFGQAYQGGSQVDPLLAVAALADDAEICGCNGICKSAMSTACHRKG